MHVNKSVTLNSLPEKTLPDSRNKNEIFEFGFSLVIPLKAACNKDDNSTRNREE